MKYPIHILAAMIVSAVFCTCSQSNKNKTEMKSYEKGTFGYDLEYLSVKDSLVILSSDDKLSQVIVSPKYQAKVFTSTAAGEAGKSLGYLNYNALDSKETNEHMNGYGGENRLWLGPEGGRYSIFFKPGSEQVYENWHTPKPIDTEPWEVVTSNRQSVVLKKDMEVANYLGNKMHLNVDRKISMLSPADIQATLGINPGNKIQSVAYATQNKITNLNDYAWTKETGTICIWMLDMFNTAPHSLTIVPFKTGDEKELGKIATTDYFGEIPAERLKIKDGVLFLKTDGKCRNKLGMNAMRTKAIAGNYDPDSKRLTITTFDTDKNGIYLNQEWNPDKNPLIGDALNAYNDGPLEDGSIMGPFLEVESASPAAFLNPGETLQHNHNVFHFVGEETDLTPITEALFGVSIEEIKRVF
ncbi:hypothetical protein DW103_14575 [Parabacteroides sp. AM08-6]|nr:hypothetical protein DW103_14575 [Parabacteroides sp. AM08-6]